MQTCELYQERGSIYPTNRVVMDMLMATVLPSNGPKPHYPNLYVITSLLDKSDQPIQDRPSTRYRHSHAKFVI